MDGQIRDSSVFYYVAVMITDRHRRLAIIYLFCFIRNKTFCILLPSLPRVCIVFNAVIYMITSLANLPISIGYFITATIYSN